MSDNKHTPGIVAPAQLESDKAARECVAYDALLGVMSIVAGTDGVVGYHPDAVVAKWSEFQEIKEAIAALARVTGPDGAHPLLLERLARITESTGQGGAE